MEDLTKASHKLAEEIYKQTAAKQQGSAGQQAGSQTRADEPGVNRDSEANKKPDAKEDVIDAEFKEEDENK